jgi:hypothetical protein
MAGYMIVSKKVVKTFEIKEWCCNPFKKLIDEGRVIFFNSNYGIFEDVADNQLIVCPFCCANLEGEGE